MEPRRPRPRYCAPSSPPGRGGRENKGLRRKGPPGAGSAGGPEETADGRKPKFVSTSRFRAAPPPSPLGRPRRGCLRRGPVGGPAPHGRGRPGGTPPCRVRVVRARPCGGPVLRTLPRGWSLIWSSPERPGRNRRATRRRRGLQMGYKGQACPLQLSSSLPARKDLPLFGSKSSGLSSSS